MGKSSSIWLPRSRYCRTIQKNTCAAIVGRLGRSSRLGRVGPPIQVICQLCSSVVYGTLTWTSLHRSGYPDPGIVGPYTNVTKKEYLCSSCRTARSLVTARSHRFRHGSVALVLPSKSFASFVLLSSLSIEHKCVQVFIDLATPIHMRHRSVYSAGVPVLQGIISPWLTVLAR